MTLKESIKRLCACPGGAGEEAPVAEALRELLSPYGQAKTDPLGNLTLTMGSGEPHILLDAHIDQISMVVTDVDERGFVRVTGCGGVDRRVLPGHRLTLAGKNGTLTGIVCSTPPHLQKGSNAKLPSWEDMAVDLCVTGQDLTDAVSLGDRLYYGPAFLELLGDCVSAPALDNRAGAAVLLEVLRHLDRDNLPCTLTLQFSTREETGEQGATVSAFSVQPDQAIIVDVSFGRAPGIRDTQASPMGGGAMIGYAASLDRAMSDRLMAIGNEKDIPVQREVMGATTGTNADAVGVSGTGVRTCTVSFPIRNMHTPVETARLCDMEASARLIAHYISEGGVGGR